MGLDANTMQLTAVGSNGAFSPEDNGKFVVRIHDEAKGLYNLCVVYKQKISLHNLKIDPTGTATTVGTKTYGAFKTLDELLSALAADPPPMGWPVSLTVGLDSAKGDLCAPTPVSDALEQVYYGAIDDGNESGDHEEPGVYEVPVPMAKQAPPALVPRAKPADNVPVAIGDAAVFVQSGMIYTRIWHNARGGNRGGAYDMHVSSVKDLAKESASILIRLAGSPETAVTLKPDVTWPLEKLAKGEPFDTTLAGASISKQIAAQTWEGPALDAMWNSGMEAKGPRSLETTLYHACNNESGLHMKADCCRFRYGTASTEDVEVWLGEPNKAAALVQVPAAEPEPQVYQNPASDEAEPLNGEPQVYQNPASNEAEPLNGFHSGPAPPSDTTSVTINKGPDGFGVKFGGCKNTKALQAHGPGIYVSGCKDGSPAAEAAEIKTGLQIVRIGDTDLTNATFVELKLALAELGDEMAIELKENPELFETYSAVAVRKASMKITSARGKAPSPTSRVRPSGFPPPVRASPPEPEPAPEPAPVVDASETENRLPVPDQPIKATATTLALDGVTFVTVPKGPSGFGVKFAGCKNAKHLAAYGPGIYISGFKDGSPAADIPELATGLQIVSIAGTDMTNATFVELKAVLATLGNEFVIGLKENAELFATYSAITERKASNVDQSAAKTAAQNAAPAAPQSAPASDTGGWGGTAFGDAALAPTNTGPNVTTVTVPKGQDGFGVKFGGCKNAKQLKAYGPGLYVKGVAPGSPAADVWARHPGLATGMQIVAIGGTDLASGTFAELKVALASLGEELELSLRKNDELAATYNAVAERKASVKVAKSAVAAVVAEQFPVSEDGEAAADAAKAAEKAAATKKAKEEAAAAAEEAAATRAAEDAAGDPANVGQRLFDACGAGDQAGCEAEIAAGADVNFVGYGGFTPLLLSASKGNIALVNVLIEAGAEVDKATTQGFTPLYMAALIEAVDVIEALADAGAELDKQDQSGCTPLFAAAVAGKVESVKTLVMKGSSAAETPKNSGETPLAAADALGHAQVAAVLRVVTGAPAAPTPAPAPEPQSEPQPQPQPQPASFIRPDSQWVHRVECAGKEEIRTWAIEKLAPGGRAFGVQDTGKFVVRLHDEKKGLFNLLVVYKMKLTMHNVRVAGADTLVSKKKFGVLDTIDDVIELLAADPPPEGWPVRLTHGLSSQSQELVDASATGISL